MVTIVAQALVLLTARQNEHPLSTTTVSAAGASYADIQPVQQLLWGIIDNLSIAIGADDPTTPVDEASPKDYIQFVTPDFSDETVEQATMLVETYTGSLDTGASHRGLAAGALYFGQILNNSKEPQQKVGAALGVSSNLVSKTYQLYADEHMNL